MRGLSDIGSKAQTLAWFAQRPSHWPHARALAARRLRRDADDRPELRERARTWARAQASPLEDVGRALGYVGPAAGPAELVGRARYDDAQARVAGCPVKLGGAGDIRLAYMACEATQATRAVETGVAYGWTSLAILSSLSQRPGTSLVSVDMPYPKLGSEDWVGVAVPEDLRAGWRLIREPDRNGLRKALSLHDGPLDVCHYDSDKSYHGRRWAYPQLWQALRPGGIFISDDIQDNFAFKEFVEELGREFFVVESQRKFVGACSKR